MSMTNMTDVTGLIPTESIGCFRCGHSNITIGRIIDDPSYGKHSYVFVCINCVKEGR